MSNHSTSRRAFVKRVGAVAGAAALPIGIDPAYAQNPLPSPGLVEPTPSNVPALNRRTLGWLRFLWEKSTTRDDWSSNGVPHPWWDRYTAPVVLSYGRFDLSYSGYGLLLMADQTPAWREVYSKIADELAGRFPTYWGAIDWLTQIGDDPKRERYPPAVMAGMPERLRGKYNRFGWTANGIQPWGLQKDPVGADGYLFFRGWFGLLLATYKYISGDDKWARPFNVTGYGDEQFEWDHHRLAARLESQYRTRPEGPQCENTKIWFFCNSAAGLGLYLYDKVYGRQTHRAVQNFFEYARQNYMGIGRDGSLEWITNYFDPVENFKSNGGAAAGLNTAFMVLPQNRELASIIYDAAANASGWRNSSAEIRANTNGLLMAREFGDTAAADRLKAAAEREDEPRFFGDRGEKFGWWFNLNEGVPRGQQSALLMVSEIGAGGSWGHAFEASQLDKFSAPTVEGVDFPALGIYQAWNDTTDGTLSVGTYAASPDRRGTSTSWRISRLPNARQVTIVCDGEPFARFEVTGADTIRIDSTIDTHQFRISTGYRGPARRAELAPDRKPVVAVTASVATPARRARTSLLMASGSAGCPCCAG